VKFVPKKYTLGGKTEVAMLDKVSQQEDHNFEAVMKETIRDFFK